jgi:AcrR family transcriptional regulator
MPGGRRPWGSISREQVIVAAMDVVASEGYERLTIRNLAAQLGVAPMSLYRHVRDKDDLLDEVVDRLLAQIWRPSAAPDNWRAWVDEAADKLRHFLVTQPAALHVYLQHPVVSHAAVARMDAMMEILRKAVMDEGAARRAYAALHTYTVGFAALEASRERWRSTEGNADHLAQQLAAYTTPRQFATGLSYVLEGISQPER